MRHDRTNPYRVVGLIFALIGAAFLLSGIIMITRQFTAGAEWRELDWVSAMWLLAPGFALLLWGPRLARSGENKKLTGDGDNYPPEGLL